MNCNITDITIMHRLKYVWGWYSHLSCHKERKKAIEVTAYIGGKWSMTIVCECHKKGKIACEQVKLSDSCRSE